ncbi:MAG: phenylpyruvate tautomerase MIF-related protein [Eubacterium sp.]
MPFINVKTNQDIAASKAVIKSELGSAITAIPGKSEGWLMVEIDDKLDMWFKGNDAPCAMFEVSIFGKASNQAYDDLTQRLCTIAQKHIGVSPDRTYVKYTEIEHWGYNGFNF